MNINITFSITIGLFSLGTLGFIGYILKEPDKFEKVIRLIAKMFRYFSKKAELLYVKYDIQSSLNSFIITIKRNVPNLSITKIKLEWIDENITQEQFIKSGQLVLRMHNSRNPNRNLVNATVAFVSCSFFYALFYRTSLGILMMHFLICNELINSCLDCLDIFHFKSFAV